MAPDYATRAWAATRVCRPLGERAVDDARTYVALELAVYVATPRQRARASGELLELVVRGAAAHTVTTRAQARELAVDVQVALGREADEVSTTAISDALARHLPDTDLHTIFARRPTPKISGWRADRIGR